MKLQSVTVGLQQKVGQPNFGSLGASCVVEVQFDDHDAGNPKAVEQGIRHAFVRCRQSIDDELGSQGSRQTNRVIDHQPNSSPPSSPEKRNPRPATEKQVRAIQLIASKQGIVLASELQSRFQVASPNQLSIGQASNLIDAMKESAAPA